MSMCRIGETVWYVVVLAHVARAFSTFEGAQAWARNGGGEVVPVVYDVT